MSQFYWGSFFVFLDSIKKQTAMVSNIHSCLLLQYRTLKFSGSQACQKQKFSFLAIGSYDLVLSNKAWAEEMCANLKVMPLKGKDVPFPSPSPFLANGNLDTVVSHLGPLTKGFYLSKSPSSDRCFAKTFSQTMAYHFILLTVYFTKQKF